MFGYYFDKYAKANRWDSKEVIFFKRMLQVGLYEEVRTLIVDKLFEKFVQVPEEAFSEELYLLPPTLLLISSFSFWVNRELMRLMVMMNARISS